MDALLPYPDRRRDVPTYSLDILHVRGSHAVAALHAIATAFTACHFSYGNRSCEWKNLFPLQHVNKIELDRVTRKYIKVQADQIHDTTSHNHL